MGRQMGFLPLLEVRDSLVQVSTGLELGICDLGDIEVGKCMAQDSTQVRREAGKCVVPSLETMDEDK